MKRLYIYANLFIFTFVLAMILIAKVSATASTEEIVYIAEEPQESVQIAEALVHIAKEKEEIEPQYVVQAIGYDWNFVTKLVMREAGADGAYLQKAVCQCIMNTCYKTGMNPEEVILNNGYASPYEYASDEVIESCKAVLLLGETIEEVEDSQYFYSTVKGFYSEWHEQQELVTQIGPVRFFR